MTAYTWKTEPPPPGGDVSQSDTISGTTAGCPSNQEQSKVSLERMVKDEHISGRYDASSPIRASKRKHRHVPRLERGKYDSIEVVDMTHTTDDTSRKPERPKKAIPRTPPAEHHCTSKGSHPLNGSSPVWRYKALVGCEGRYGKPFVRVAWYSTWEPVDEFPPGEVERVRLF